MTDPGSADAPLGLGAVLSRFPLTPAPGEEALDRLAAYFTLRARWALAHNLSGPRALRDPSATDLADAAALACQADRDLPLLDIGAGSGVPSVLVSILSPRLAVVALEPSAKRAAFLRQVAATLSLTRFEVRRESWPVSVAVPTQLVSRAVFPVPDWPTRAAAGGPGVSVIHRFLARERPPFGVDGFELACLQDYLGPGAAAHRLETWRRLKPSASS